MRDGGSYDVSKGRQLTQGRRAPTIEARKAVCVCVGGGLLGRGRRGQHPGEEGAI